MRLTMDNLTIRLAVVADAPLLGNWWRDGKVMAHAGYPLGLDIDDEAIEQSLTRGDRLIIEVDGKPAGEMCCRDKGRKTAEIGIKICDFSQQNKGYGTKFLEMLIYEIFTNLGYEKIVLDTDIENLRAQRTYERLGFNKTAVRKDFARNQIGELISSVEYELHKNDYIANRKFQI